MTQTYFPFDSGSGANVTEVQWQEMAQYWLNTGVIRSVLNELEVYADSTGMQVKVKTGEAWIKGHFFKSDEEEALAIGTADASNPRIDRVIIRLDWTANTIQLAILQGAAATSPVAPALTQNTSRWEISLSQVNVGAGVTTIAAEDIIMERDFTEIDYSKHKNDDKAHTRHIAAKNASESGSDYTSGTSLFVVSSTETGWPNSAGTVVTHKLSNLRVTQWFFYNGNGNATRAWVRHWYDTSWTPWEQLHGKALGEGLRVTSGKVSISAAAGSNGSATITFAKAFSQAPNVTASLQGTDLTNYGKVGAHDITTTGATITFKNDNTVDVTSIPFNWIAVGQG
ncbi:H-type lectin domain-containing protein [Alkalihalobacillus sp. BA299]|uniref:H-type lectin domain-containing protein n=1 Tax=Alkalihalobacillus sp. BA299 TaxID=2815938 RepID=UPI001ADA963E|nr:H-type lectin domain-containing protein [Alkalihalobacillus sp. BA299]